MNRAPFTRKVADDLEAGLPAGVELGRGRPPKRGDVPFVILYVVEGGAWIGPPVDLDADAVLPYKTKVVARREEDEEVQNGIELGANDLADLVHGLMLLAGDGVPGLTVMRRFSAAVAGNDTDNKYVNADETFYYMVTTS